MSQITSRTLKKVRKTNKGRTNKRETNKRKTNKRKTNKRKTNKRKTNKKISRTKRGGNDSSSSDNSSPSDNVNKDSTINIKYTTAQNPMHPQTYTIGECAICLDEIDEGEFVTTECKHTFHPNCFMELCSSGRDPKCPLCRKDISSECKQLQQAFRKAFETQKTVYTKGKLGG